MRSALRRVNGCLKTMIEAIADSKVRRMRRDLALRGIHFDSHRNNWVRARLGAEGPFAMNRSVLISLLRGVVRSVVTFLGPSWDGPAKRYHPEEHYMRRSRAEMAGEALSRPCIGRRRVRLPCEAEPALRNFASSTASARGKALPQVIPASDGPAGRRHGCLAVADRPRRELVSDGASSIRARYCCRIADAPAFGCRIAGTELYAGPAEEVEIRPVTSRPGSEAVDFTARS